ncbi:CMRF35-like molecule 8 [Sardina pilchardus]|uniref:CMRF35-like molecule 8 n=1 Tax=Sardina pilchardus TaxID=27697 RepID=UPI002E101F61
METPFFFFVCLLAGVLPAESVISETGYVGRSAVIRCSYEKQYERKSKYLCRGTCPRIFGSKDIPISTEAGQTKAINDRFSLHDDTTAGVFTVTITELTAKDSGKYWCAIARPLGKLDVYTEVNLNVKKGPPPTQISTHAPSTEPQTVSSSPSSSPPASNTSQSGLIRMTTTSAEPQEDPEDSVVMVILCVLMLLVMMCGLVSALYYRQRRRKQTAACGPSSLHSDHVREPNGYNMSDELGSIPASRASVSRRDNLAGASQRPSMISLCSTVRPVTQGSDQPIYCNSHEDNVIYSNDILPEETTSPTMHYSFVFVPQLGNTVNTHTLVRNREGDFLYSEVRLPKM